MSVDLKTHNEVLNLPKQCHNLHVDRYALQIIFLSDFSAFSKMGSHCQIAFIQKAFQKALNHKNGISPGPEVVSESHRFFLSMATRALPIFITSFR